MHHNEDMTSRRDFLKAGAAATLAAAAPAAQLKDIGVQLYTVRTILPQKPEETLRDIRAIGYREIEATLAGFDKIWPAVQAAGLRPVSMHLDANQVMHGGDGLHQTASQLQKYGFQYAVFPYLAPSARGGPEVIRALAGKLNDAAAIFAGAGLKFCYHNHAFEFESVNGSTLFDVLADNTDPKLVGFELVLFWVSVAGHDPVEMIHKMGRRAPLVHLKDKQSGTPLMYNESVPRTAFREVGHGTIDWPKVLRAASAAGVSHYFVEQDQTPGNPVDSLRESYEYLSKLTW